LVKPLKSEEWRGEDARVLFSQIEEKLGELLGTQRRIFLFPCGEKEAFEAAVVNFFSPGDRVLFPIVGEAGENWAHIAETHGVRAVRLGSERGRSVTGYDVELLLESEKEAIRGVCVSYHDASFGVCAEVSSFMEVCRRRNILGVVEALDFWGVTELYSDPLGIDIFLTLIYPGVSCFVVSPPALSSLERIKALPFSLDLRQGREILSSSPSLLSQVFSSLEREFAHRVQALAHARRVTKTLREGIRALGLELLVTDERIASLLVTTVVIPPDIPGRVVLEALQKQGMPMVSGVKRMADQVIRVEERYFACGEDIASFLRIFGEALLSQGARVDVPAGVNRVWEVWNDGE